jgi:hypothetical protein
MVFLNKKHGLYDKTADIRTGNVINKKTFSSFSFNANHNENEESSPVFTRSNTSSEKYRKGEIGHVKKQSQTIDHTQIHAKASPLKGNLSVHHLHTNIMDERNEFDVNQTMRSSATIPDKTDTRKSLLLSSEKDYNSLSGIHGIQSDVREADEEEGINTVSSSHSSKTSRSNYDNLAKEEKKLANLLLEKSSEQRKEFTKSKSKKRNESPIEDSILMKNDSIGNHSDDIKRSKRKHKLKTAVELFDR